MSVQETIGGIMSALWWLLVGVVLACAYRWKIAQTPVIEKVLVERICVTANRQEYCKDF